MEGLNKIIDKHYNLISAVFWRIVALAACGTDETVCFDSSVNAEELLCPACQSPLGCIIEDDDVNPVEE